MDQFLTVELERHGRTVGWVDEGFYRTVRDYLPTQNAPAEVAASVELLEAFRRLDFAAAAAAADRVGIAADRAPLLPRTLLLDAAVAAYVSVGRPEAARAAIAALEPLTGRPPGHARALWLAALAGVPPG